MSKIIGIDTPRLQLRRWRRSDRVPFAALNADPVVMEFSPGLQSRAASDASIDAWPSQFDAQGWKKVFFPDPGALLLRGA